jgi:calcineurin-like phosphoesterase family protein
MAIFLTADYHLGETRLEILQRPFKTTDEMVDELKRRHNSMVKASDTVIFNGDVCYQGAPEYHHHMADFNGIKTLIRGNHDRVFTDEQLAPYFERIIPEGEGIELEFGGIPCYVTHYPTKSVRNKFNIIGHIHTAWKVQLNMLNVGVDVHHFYPLPVEKVPFFFTAIKDYYDEDCWAAYHESNTFFRGLRGKKGSYLDVLK